MSMRESLSRVWREFKTTKKGEVLHTDRSSSVDNGAPSAHPNQLTAKRLNAVPSKRTKREYTAKFDYLIDLVLQNDKPAFLAKNADKLEIWNHVEIEGKTFHPPEPAAIPFLVPDAEEVIEAYQLESQISTETADLATFEALIQYHKDISELPTERHYLLLAAWDIHTYFQDQLQYSPIICLYAVPERGKSRTGKSMINVAYRGMHVESLREAYILRVAEYFQASLFIDVMNPWKKAEKMGVEDILLQRFERGTTVPRVLFPERGAFKDTVYFHVFGPLILGTNMSLHQILDTRSIQVNMPQSIRAFETEVTPELAISLKVRLLALRARHLDRSLPNINKPVRGRLGDICKPLVQVVQQFAPCRESEFLELIRLLETRRLTEKSDTLDAQIIRTICALEHIVEKGIVPNKTITDALNKDKSDRYMISYQRVGRKLTALGFEKVKTGTGASAIVWDTELLKRIKDAYGLEETSETSEIPMESAPKDLLADVSDVSDPLDLQF